MKIKVDDLIYKISDIERMINNMCDGDYSIALDKETVIEWLQEYRDILLNAEITIR